jgi:hypothetical protein
MILAPTEAAQVDHNSHDENHQINARRRLSRIRHPGLRQRRQR